MNALAASNPHGTGSVVLDDLAEVIGIEAAFALAWEFRGEPLYIPKDPAVEPRIAAAIGDALAAKLCDVFWRTSIYVPKREAERREVQRLRFTERLTHETISRQLRISIRQVYRLLESPPIAGEAIRRGADDRQMPLL